MEEEKKNQQSGLGVGALVTAIIAFLLAVVPCFGLVAIIPAVIAIVLAIVGLSRPDNAQGILVGGLVVAIVALMISTSQGFVMGRIAHKSGDWGTEIEKAVKDVTDDLEKEFGNKHITIRVDEDDQTREIKTPEENKDLRNKLEELEGVADTVKTQPEKTSEPQK
jgi:hypothetical protein